MPSHTKYSTPTILGKQTRGATHLIAFFSLIAVGGVQVSGLKLVLRPGAGSSFPADELSQVFKTRANIAQPTPRNSKKPMDQYWLNVVDKKDEGLDPRDFLSKVQGSRERKLDNNISLLTERSLVDMKLKNSADIP